MSALPKILFIDDEEDLLMLASSFFEEEGFHLDVCSNYEDALNKIRQQSYDLIISDSRMPTGSGEKIFNTIKQQNIYSGKFILVTGNVEVSDSNDPGEFDAVLYKPIRFQELVNYVKDMFSL